MKRAFACLCALSMAAGIASAAAPKKAPSPPVRATPRRPAPTPRSAPGDEYFGRMKWSYLGINNMAHDQAIHAGAYTVDSGIINQANFGADALSDWQSKYPDDPEIPRTMFLLAKLYQKIWTAEGQSAAARYLLTLSSRYAKTYFGKTVKAQLQKGFTEHILAPALPCPTPSPILSVVGVPTSTPAPTPTPISTNAPSSNIHFSIVQSPCYTPTPAPTPTPTPSPTPAPSSSPRVTPSATASPTSLPSGRVTATPIAVPTASAPRTMLPMPSPTPTRQ